MALLTGSQRSPELCNGNFAAPQGTRVDTDQGVNNRGHWAMVVLTL